MSQRASLTGDKLYVALLNKDTHQPVTVRVTIEDWRHQASVEVREVGAESYLAENTIQRPDEVKLSGPKVERAEASGQMNYLLKPNTLAVLRFQRDGSR